MRPLARSKEQGARSKSERSDDPAKSKAFAAGEQRARSKSERSEDPAKSKAFAAGEQGERMKLNGKIFELKGRM